jgi:hypothetical protein
MVPPQQLCSVYCITYPPEDSVGYPTWVSLEDKLPIPKPVSHRKLIVGDNQAARL